MSSGAFTPARLKVLFFDHLIAAWVMLKDLLSSLDALSILSEKIADYDIEGLSY